MSEPVPIQFGEWMPDQQALSNPGATIAENVVPALNTYQQVNSFSPAVAASTNAALGGFTARDKSNNVYIIYGTSTDLYSVSANTLTDVTRLSGDYAAAEGEMWEFVKWDENIIGTNFTDEIQILVLGAANFSDLTTTPPQARHISIIRDFIVLGNIDDSTDGLVPNRVHWSGFDNETQWVPGTNQSDYQDLKGDGGWVQRVIGGEYGVIFQERAVWRMTYVGLPAIFQFDEVEPAKGTPAPGSVVRYGREIYYLGNDGFYVIRDGTTSQNISAEKVTQFFFEDADKSQYFKMTSAIDTKNNLVFWAYQRNESPSDTVNRVLVYNWVTQRWSYINTDLDILFQSATAGYTLEELNSFGTMDTLPASLDSDLWKGGGVILAGVDANHQFGVFSGDPLTAVLETKEVGNDYHTMFDAYRSDTEGAGSITVELLYRNSLGSTPTTSGALSPNSNGRYKFRRSARYHRIRETIVGGFTHAIGGHISLGPGGKR